MGFDNGTTPFDDLYDCPACNGEGCDLCYEEGQVDSIAWRDIMDTLKDWAESDRAEYLADLREESKIAFDDIVPR